MWIYRTSRDAFANASSAATTTMPAGAAAITANWTVNSSDDGTSTTAVPVSGGSGAVHRSASISGRTATISATDAQLQKIASGTETGAVKIDASDLKANTVVVPSKLVKAENNASNSTGPALALPTGTLTRDKTAHAMEISRGGRPAWDVAMLKSIGFSRCESDPFAGTVVLREHSDPAAPIFLIVPKNRKKWGNESFLIPTGGLRGICGDDTIFLSVDRRSNA
ncbi:MAG: hypothetical protein VB055_04320 [Oscillospiraceae bacterium]|nr:hypothetical protein [Oscillospiraceae bacterium]